jgi:tetratricopeptide (TPR) repeat protein
MGFRNRGFLPLLLLLGLCVTPACRGLQREAQSDQAQRAKASEFFSQGKRLEALPLLEELVRAHPQDPEMLVALAACLVEHSSTLTDPDQAARERFRARDLLQKGWDLGNTSPLAESLLQLLGQLPKNGEVRFSEKPEVQQIMLAGEAAFARRDFDEALKDYARARELEPSNYAAALFTANTWDRKDDFARAREWYERAIQLDLNVETAWRYYADMLAKQGDMTRARKMLIGAAVAEPYNRIVWRELNAWATLNKTTINFVYVGIPALPKEAPAQNARLDPNRPPEVSAAWLAYHAVRARWQQEGEFRKHYPRETEYRHSLGEEAEALKAAAAVLQKLRDDEKTAVMIQGDQALTLLLNLQQAGLMESYVLFSLGDAGIARDYSAYRDKNRGRLEEYVEKFVVPPAP